MKPIRFVSFFKFSSLLHFIYYWRFKHCLVLYRVLVLRLISFNMVFSRACIICMSDSEPWKKQLFKHFNACQYYTMHSYQYTCSLHVTCQLHLFFTFPVFIAIHSETLTIVKLLNVMYNFKCNVIKISQCILTNICKKKTIKRRCV